MTEFISFETSIPEPTVLPNKTEIDIEFYDPPMCCSTGLCGPTLDQTLLDVNEMIQGLQANGLRVARYQIASHPRHFMSNPEILRLVRANNVAALPITTVRGRIIKVGEYPTQAEVYASLNEVELE